ncbi:MAG: 3-dehydroquinate synthase family protein [Candidatus Cryptobacteroides sp.]|nr:3-dehydroquinate synthase family protein [Candidatus Cryptobacteroides sp.]
MNPIYIKEDYSGLREAIGAFCPDRIFVVCDRAVAHLVPRLGLDAAVVELEASEEKKSLRTVEEICRALLEGGADRKSFVLALGGGIISDMAGFAASIYMRGIRFAYVPTTLLAMTDAAIGGKTGVNFLSYKNILGSFTEPCFTWMAAASLEGLPRREVLSGAAEMLKSFIIDNVDGAYSTALEFFRTASMPEKCDAATAARLLPLARAAAGVKAGIVSRDFRESGERKLLNLGHSFAHAIEHLAQTGADGTVGISHGEAVSMGIVLAARLSCALGYAPKGFDSSLEADFAAAGLRVKCPYAPRQLVQAMSRDKKAEAGTLSFVLMRGISDVFVEKLEPAKAMALLNE